MYLGVVEKDGTEEGRAATLPPKATHQQLFSFPLLADWRAGQSIATALYTHLNPFNGLSRPRQQLTVLVFLFLEFSPLLLSLLASLKPVERSSPTFAAHTSHCKLSRSQTNQFSLSFPATKTRKGRLIHVLRIAQCGKKQECGLVDMLNRLVTLPPPRRAAEDCKKRRRSVSVRSTRPRGALPALRS